MTTSETKSLKPGDKVFVLIDDPKAPLHEAQVCYVAKRTVRVQYIDPGPARRWRDAACHILRVYQSVESVAPVRVLDYAANLAKYQEQEQRALEHLYDRLHAEALAMDRRRSKVQEALALLKTLELSAEDLYALEEALRTKLWQERWA